MKNRERLLKTSVYDTLVRMNVNLITDGGCSDKCVMDALIGDCQKVSDRCLGLNQCEQCIQTWLNEEE